jgi:hypothetical protein
VPQVFALEGVGIAVLRDLVVWRLSRFGKLCLTSGRGFPLSLMWTWRLGL